MKSIAVRLSDKLLKALDQAVKQERSTRSNLLRQALEAFLRRRREDAELEKYKEAARHIQRPWDDEEEDLWTIAANEALDNYEKGQDRLSPVAWPSRPRAS